MLIELLDSTRVAARIKEKVPSGGIVNPSLRSEAEEQVYYYYFFQLFSVKLL